MTRAALLAYIDNNVYPNANNEITALMVRDVLHHMVDFLGDAATYGVGDVALNNGGLVTGGAVQSAINTTLSSAIMFQGVTTTPLTDGSTNPDITIDGESYTAHRGDEVIYGGKEFLWTGTKWQQLGDEESWAAKTITISAGTGLTGGGNLTQNRTISLSQDSLEKLALAASAYQLPTGGIPLADLAAGVQSSLGKADSAYQLPQGGIPKTDLASAVQNSLGKADTVAGYFSNDKLKLQNLPALYVARTQVSGTAANKTLYGVDGISAAAAADANDKSLIEWDDTNEVWHVHGGLYADGVLSGGGLSQSSPGGGGGGLDPALMWKYLTNDPTLSSNPYANTKIADAHLPDLNPGTGISASYSGNLYLNLSLNYSAVAGQLGLSGMAYKPANQQTIIDALGYTPANVTALAGYLPLAGGTMSNTNLVTNLNADLLDGCHEGNFVGNNRGYLTDFNIAYSSSVHFIDPNCVNGPGANYGQALIIHSDGDTTAQLAFPYSRTTGFLRVGRAFGAEWQNWREFAFLDSNVASATNATYADMLDGLHASGFLRNYGLNPYTYSSEISSQGTCTLDTGLPETPDNSYNTSYLTLGEYTWPRFKQLAFCYDTDNIWYRRNAGDGWTSWVKLWNSSNSNKSDVAWACSTLTASGDVESNSCFKRKARGSLSDDLIVGDAGLGDDGIYYNSSNNWFRIQSQSNILLSATQGTTAAATRYDLFVQASTGYVGIGTRYPAYPLDVAGVIHSTGQSLSDRGFSVTGRSGDGTYGISLYGDISYMSSYGIWMGLTSVGGTCGAVSGNWATYFTMDGSTDRGWVFKHSGTNVASVSSGGVLYASTGIFTEGYLSGGGLSQSSDQRLKRFIEDFSYTPGLLMALRPREWEWNEKTPMKGHAAGFVAQEVEGLLPYMVDDTREYLALYYDQFHALEVSALQDHEHRIVELEKAVEDRDRQIAELRLRLNMN